MKTSDKEILGIVQTLRSSIASKALTEHQARLYSHSLRISLGHEGLKSFTDEEIDENLNEAMLLVQCALIERKIDIRADWSLGIKRAAEILEWISKLNDAKINAPVGMLSVAAYQLANYPAMALGQMKNISANPTLSPILKSFLSANFPSTLTAIHEFWQTYYAESILDKIDQSDFTSQVIYEVVRCLGVVSTYIQSGSEEMYNLCEKAESKLLKLSDHFIYSRDSYSYFLSTLTALSSQHYQQVCLWRFISGIQKPTNETLNIALSNFARKSFLNRRSLIWPAQATGIGRLSSLTSFALCTPTGSGKTTVATFAVIQALFSKNPAESKRQTISGQGNMALYLVPTRALAAEVEFKLGQDLKGISRVPIVITGLYGGIDWGPTDAWIQSDQPTILICTYEKADALLRYLSIFFLNRVKLVIIDEAHMVEQDPSRLRDIENGTSRSLRLEQLVTRLLRAQDDYKFRIIALSAVAASSAPALARWISGNLSVGPITSSYRSTRQMLGRLEVSPANNFTIRYELMDSNLLKFQEEGRDDNPYIPNPIPRSPDGLEKDTGPETRLRAPTLWAALHLASVRTDGTKPSVLISITENLEGFASSCADLIEQWVRHPLPNYWVNDMENLLWKECLSIAADYFSAESIEYRLLCHGIALHHGKMPGLLSRHIKALIDRGDLRVVIATSTLSEGVNIPINYLLIPSLWRLGNGISLQEFTNLIGRAGRPGTATEGAALVVLPERTWRRSISHQIPNRSRQWVYYEFLLGKIIAAGDATVAGRMDDRALSPLSLLITRLKNEWSKLANSQTEEDFINWLEKTAVEAQKDDVELDQSIRCLDSLDGVLIAAIQEAEKLANKDLEPSQIETELKAIWQKTYAFAAQQNENDLTHYWLVRGNAIKQHYPDPIRRRLIYKSSLTPRSADSLIIYIKDIRKVLSEGVNYPNWNIEDQFKYVSEVVSKISQVPSFSIGTILGRARSFSDWPIILRWWLAKETLVKQPSPKVITNWYNFVSQNFIYRINWGLGCIIGILMDENSAGQELKYLEIEDWPKSGLPWIAFWLKELITWGTLDPVVAFLMARGKVIDRHQATIKAAEYYSLFSKKRDPNAILDPRLIRDWVNSLNTKNIRPIEHHNVEVNVTLDRAARDYQQSRYTVLPLEINETLAWITPAGYRVAHSNRIEILSQDFLSYVFELDIPSATVRSYPYLQYE